MNRVQLYGGVALGQPVRGVVRWGAWENPVAGMYATAGSGWGWVAT